MDAQFLVKPAAVVDASVLRALHFDEASAADVAKYMGLHKLHATQLISFEIANVSIKKIRSHWSVDEAQDTLSDFSHGLSATFSRIGGSN